ncbi:MAG: hypothetical protein LIQ31_08160 [Planctomycetes bacterium]|nr:hypothetical protein [Planctomycetota bacterium]
MINKSNKVLLLVLIVGILLIFFVSKLSQERNGVETKQCENSLPDLRNVSYPLPTDLDFEGISTECLADYAFDLMKLVAHVYVKYEILAEQSNDPELYARLEVMNKERYDAYTNPINDVILRETPPETPYEIKERMITVKQIRMNIDWLNRYHEESTLN